MRAILCKAWGEVSSLALQEIAPRSPAPGEIRLRVRACGVNFADTLMVAGKYQFRPPLPFSPGMEMAGEVLEVGKDVAGITPGERVVAMSYYGGFAEEATIPAGLVIPLPPAMDDVTAAAFPGAYGTAHMALWHRARLQPGERLLVLGAAGGVGLSAVEIGALMGAEVIAAASTDEKLALARKHGAAHTINYSHEPLRGRVREITAGQGVDVVFDPVGGDLFKAAFRSVAWEGRYLVVGFASGEIPQTSVNRLLIDNFALVGVEWGTYTRRGSPLVRQSLKMLLGWWEQGRIRPHVSATYPLARTVEALEEVLARRTTGRVVILPHE
ncbi:MAG: NADPH:quinone oxidoreductase family protein [Anaerolineae bacterium]